jgi:hypothetical protein
VCSALTVCDVHTQYENAAPTATTDRQCSTVAPACGPTEYEHAAPTATSDRVCAMLAVCSANQLEMVPATATSDRECVDAVLVGGGRVYCPSEASVANGCVVWGGCLARACKRCEPGFYQEGDSSRACPTCPVRTSVSATRKSIVSVFAFCLV